MYKILFLIILLFLSILHGSYLDQGNKALKDKNIESAIKLFKLSAREGSDEANFILGKIFYLDKYQRKDMLKAFKYFKKAADYEHQKAKYNLAIIYSQKKFKNHSYKRAYELFLSLAKQGYPNAQYMVGIYLMKGFGIPKEYDTAKLWLEEAYFKNNYKKASCAIAYIYANGLGVIQNLGRARKLSEMYRTKFPLCKKVFIEFNLHKKKYSKDKGFKMGYYR